jgi:hypothetical protein
MSGTQSNIVSFSDFSGFRSGNTLLQPDGSRLQLSMSKRVFLETFKFKWLYTRIDWDDNGKKQPPKFLPGGWNQETVEYLDKLQC